ncbi:hypothetical protein BDN67DRAFT_980788 [Paxillus ammoniavirescens]|nr:hypothetical protein BDN67DRAFT_980788 [Paxillus ammoniavirescens]
MSIQIFGIEGAEEKAEIAHLSSFVGAAAVGDLAKFTLGPKGMDKTLQFYLQNLHCETDPFIVIAACCYLVGKAKESLHIRTVVAEARLFFGRAASSLKHILLKKVVFYLVADLKCDFAIFHPYQTLMALCKKESSSDFMAEVREVVADLKCDFAIFHPYQTLMALCKKESSSDFMAEVREVDRAGSAATHSPVSRTAPTSQPALRSEQKAERMVADGVGVGDKFVKRQGTNEPCLMRPTSMSPASFEKCQERIGKILQGVSVSLLMQGYLRITELLLLGQFISGTMERCRAFC